MTTSQDYLGNYYLQPTTYQTKPDLPNPTRPTKLNLTYQKNLTIQFNLTYLGTIKSNLIYKTWPTIPKLQNPTYQTQPTKPILPNPTYQTQPTKPNLPNHSYKQPQWKIKQKQNNWFWHHCN